MIEILRGNLLDADVEALVNTVNTVGVMGKGIALQFKKAFPENFDAYKRACDRKEVQSGKMFVYSTGSMVNPRFIINFPTKCHWRDRSRMQDIEEGLRDLVRVISRNGIRSVALPPLGCGNGGLNWDEVRSRIQEMLEDLQSVRILLYEPAGAPHPDRMRVATKTPKMTPSRAAILAILYRYAIPGYRLSMLEVQKLAYFLQETGEPLRLNFTANQYGPYAEALHHVLQRMEGHFIRGYGDRSQKALEPTILVLPEAIRKTEEFLAGQKETQDRVDRVTQLIEGFETPYCLEMLATIHWISKENPAEVVSAEKSVESVWNWNERKRKLFKADHIRVAWQQLRDECWI
ncbi:MAG TPA: macro domain-containing protein [bacterium]|nr:macro domain-containing protein [bacterium]HQL61143.1 macro domain-containing protein [bacterium]